MKKILLNICLLPLLLTSCGRTSSGVDTNSSSESSSESLTPMEKYTRARSNTVESEQFEYSFALEAKLKYKGALSYSPAKISGTTKWIKDAEHTNYYQERSNSGLLLIDSTTYFYNIDNTYIKMSADESKGFSITNQETITSDYNFESKSFGKLLNYLAPAVLSKVDYSESKYNLSINLSSSKEAINSLVNFVDVSKFVDCISSITENEWGVGLSLNCYATIADNHINTFYFGFTLEKSDFSITLSYQQNYARVGSGVSIVLPTFSNAITDVNTITSELSTLSGYYDATMKQTNSEYTYSLKTAVDHGASKSNPLGLAVNSTSAGRTKRTIESGKVYFDNRLELNSDYQNSDQYPDDVTNYERYRANIKASPSVVYDCIDEAWPTPNTCIPLNGYDNYAIDEYYMLPSINYLSLDNIKIMSKTTSSSGTSYKFGLSLDAVKMILTDYNKSIRLDADLTKWIDVYSIKDDGSFLAKKVNFTISLDSSNRLQEINLVMKGFYNMVDSNQVKFGFDLNVTYDWTKSAYVVPTKDSEIELFNS